MFAIYDITGRTFRDSLERLYRVKQVNSINSSKGRSASQQDAISTLLPGAVVKAYKDALPKRASSTIVHADQIMSTPVLTTLVSTPPESCWELLNNNGVGQVPVIGETGVLAGIIAKHDLFKAMVIDGDTIVRKAEKPLAQIMSPQVVTADPVSDIRRIAQVLDDYHFNSLPITDYNDQLVGMVTRTDIIRAVARHPSLSLWA